MKREAIRYLENAREVLKKAPIEDNTFTDIKPVQEACETAYLAIIKAIDEHLVNSGIGPKDLPQSIDEYRKIIRKHLSTHNARFPGNLKSFTKHSIWQGIIGGY